MARTGTAAARSQVGRTPPAVTVSGGSIATTTLLTDGSTDAVAVPVAPARAGDDALRPLEGTADAAARYGVDLAEIGERARLTGAAGEVYVLQLPRPVGSSVTLPWADLPPRLVLVGVGAGRPADLRRAGAALAALVARAAPGGHHARRRGAPGRVGRRQRRAGGRGGLPAGGLRPAQRRDATDELPGRRRAGAARRDGTRATRRRRRGPHRRDRDVAGAGPGHDAVQHQDARLARRPGQAAGDEGRARGHRPRHPGARRGGVRRHPRRRRRLGVDPPAGHRLVHAVDRGRAGTSSSSARASRSTRVACRSSRARRWSR